MADRKKDHIELAFQSQLSQDEMDTRFYYEPIIRPHPKNEIQETETLGKIFKVPLWVSSMTGGTEEAMAINTNLAKVCREFGFGMGLGSCRSLLESDERLADFNLRKIIGDEQALYTNLGIGQVEELINTKKLDKIRVLIDKLSADGLIIHINPLQELFQPEGNKILQSPLDTIKEVLDKLDIRLIVKEVGQGMGPESLTELLKLPLEAIEFAAFGGTNFAKLELMRGTSDKEELFSPLAKIGVDAYTMLNLTNAISEQTMPLVKSLIISGGIKNFLDGYYLTSKSKMPAIYGQASTFLKYAKNGYESLHKFVDSQIQGLKLAANYLSIRT